MKQPRRLDAATRPLDLAAVVPPSKSLTNRALVAAAAAGGGTVQRPLDAEDTRLLAGALDACGWEVSWGESVEVEPRRAGAAAPRVDLGNSGTGCRLLLALLAASPGSAEVDGSPRLRKRPMATLLDALRRLGAGIDATASVLPVRVAGRRLAGGRLQLAPGASSQFASALLMAAPLMERGLELELTGEVPSRPYLLLTAEVLRAFGAGVSGDPSGRHWRVAPGGLRATSFTVEGDWSAAAFFLAAAAVAPGTVRVAGLREDSAQGDRSMVEILRAAGVEVTFDAAGVIARGPAQRPVMADLHDTPDLFPALAAVAACVPPGSRLLGLENLRHKESDRLTVMVENLRALGAEVTVDEAGRAAHFRRGLVPAAAGRPVPELPAADDHRVAMALAVAALRAGPLLLDDAGCVAKSFPGFWEQWAEPER